MAKKRGPDQKQGWGNTHLPHFFTEKQIEKMAATALKQPLCGEDGVPLNCNQCIEQHNCPLGQNVRMAILDPSTSSYE